MPLRAVHRTTTATPLGEVNLNHHQTRGRTASSRKPSHKTPAAKSKGKGRPRSATRKKKAPHSTRPPTATYEEPRHPEPEEEELEEEEPEEEEPEEEEPEEEEPDEEEPDEEELEEEEAEHSDSSYTLDPDDVGSDGEESQNLLRPSNIAPVRTTLDVRVPRSAIGGGGVRRSDFARRNSTGGPGRGVSSARGRPSSVGGRTGQPRLLAGRGHSRASGGGASGRSGAGASDGRGRASSVGGGARQSSVLGGRGSGSASGGAPSGWSGAGSSEVGGSTSGVSSDKSARGRQATSRRVSTGNNGSEGSASGTSHSGGARSGGATGGGSTSTGASTTTFRTLGKRSLQQRHNSEERHETGIGGVSTINMEMSGQNIFDALDTARVPKAAKAALLGLLLQLISPDVANMLGGDSPKKAVGPGEKTARGVAANVMGVFAYGFVGPARMQFSSGGATNAMTNPFIALGSHAWPGARQNLNTFPAIFVRAVVSARSDLHADIRSAVAEFLIPLMELEASTNNPMTGADLLRGVRERVMDVDPESEELVGLMTRIMWRFTKAHQASTRKALTLEYLLGPERLNEDFLGQVVTPALLHAANDISALPVNEIGTHETIVCKVTRKARSWIKLSNGGFGSANARAFQETLWYNLFQFMTGPRRYTASILTIPQSDFHKPEIRRFLAPYYVDKDSLVVPETPAADVHVQDDDLEAYLDDMY